ncbi:hypothetical protein HN615_08030 [Candidatus Woesearchaeota archaeon]|nr:hypothetical protein [Candidatus Woesearchaeota archaeon]
MHSDKKWVFCDNYIHRSLIEFGKYSANVRYRISFAVFSKLLFFLTYSFFKVLYYYFSQFFIIYTGDIKDKRVIFLKSGNGYDYDNLYKAFDHVESEVVCINSFTMKSYMSVTRVGFYTLIGTFLHSVIAYLSVVREHLPKHVEYLVIDNGLRNISQYTFLLSFFKTVYSLNDDIHVCSGGAMLASNASISARLKTSYLLHGNIGSIHPIVFPDFYKVYVYSYDEKLYLDNSGISSDVLVYPYENISTHNKLVVVFMRIDDEKMNFHELRNLVVFFKFNNYLVKFKLHPQYNGENIYDWANTLNVEVVNEDIGSASSLISSTLPSFVVAWQSTSLCESLNMGVIPISLSKKSEIRPDSIYPIVKRTLSWHDEKKQIISAVNQQADYCKILRALTN